MYPIFPGQCSRGIFKKLFMKINDLAHGIHIQNKEAGYWKHRYGIPLKMVESGLFSIEEVHFIENANISQCLMLGVTEISEAVEALRKDKRADVSSYEEAIQHYNGCDDMKVKAFESFVKNTVEDEFADILIRILDLSNAMGIDIDKHIHMKRCYNHLMQSKKNEKSF